MGLYIARDRDTTSISRTKPRIPGRQVRRRWSALVETRVPTHPAQTDRSVPMVVAIGLPPVLVALIGIHFLSLELGIALGAFLLLALSSLVPALARRRSGRARRDWAEGARTLTAAPERTAMGRAVATADRISETWPALGARRRGRPGRAHPAGAGPQRELTALHPDHPA
ncbi:hypothetical protein [Actinoplanes sp. NPDC026619]|uniref:hypothetical protein n=1 Tax=Actinoplanes sp. NPDC026619 TaxID=3155798 RepID=UPI0033F03C30